MESHQLDRAVRRSFLALCQNVDTPISQQAIKSLNESDWVALTTIEVVIEDYTCPRLLSADLQIAAFFKKYPGFNLGIDLEARAVSAFFDNERQCFLSNKRLTPLLDDPYHYGDGVHDFLGRARKEVRRILGPCPKRGELRGRFGPGSTYGEVGPYITVPDKMSDSYTMTSKARPFLTAWDQTAWSRFAAANDLSSFEKEDALDSAFDEYAPRVETLVKGNRFTTVPKDAWKHRGICIEPSINVFYQLGVGEHMTRRLKRTCGWDKKTVQELHRLLAKISSKTGINATIDLSNASDTICEVLVKLLLPWDWYELLDDLRSSYTQIQKKWVKLEKFSSMGNGFTFELETIIFRSIVIASQKEAFFYNGEWFGGDVSVFGDDIVCPTSSAKDVIAALKFFGLEVNKNKTFINGKFRESCGGDFFDGLNVRPHYLKESPSEPHQFIALANGLRRFGIRHILCGGPDVYSKPRLCILDAIPSKIRDLRGPEELGDIVIWDDESRIRYNYTVRSSIRYLRVWRPVMFARTRWDHFRPGVVLASALYGASDGRTMPIGSQDRVWIDTGGVSQRVNGEYVSGHRFGRVMFS